MKRLSVLSLVCLAAFALPAHAAPILSTNFCPGNATCPDGVTEARISISADTLTLDENDYFLTVTFAGDATAPAFLDEFSFTLSGVSTPDGYTTQPSLLSASTDENWQVFYDNIAANASSCTSNTDAANEVCTQSVGTGNNGAPLPGQTLTFEYYVDLAGTLQIVPTTSVNLRAQFLNADGSNAGILSPDSNGIPDAPVPEPASMILLGTGLLGLAGRLRKCRA